MQSRDESVIVSTNVEHDDLSPTLDLDRIRTGISPSNIDKTLPFRNSNYGSPVLKEFRRFREINPRLHQKSLFNDAHAYK
jgi:hypothetical protein